MERGRQPCHRVIMPEHERKALGKPQWWLRLHLHQWRSWTTMMTVEWWLCLYQWQGWTTMMTVQWWLCLYQWHSWTTLSPRFLDKKSQLLYYFLARPNSEEYGNYLVLTKSASIAASLQKPFTHFLIPSPQCLPHPPPFWNKWQQTQWVLDYRCAWHVPGDLSRWKSVGKIL